MKRIVGVLVVTMLALAAVPAQAQLRFGVKGGVNIANVSFSTDVIDPDNTTGFMIGPMLEANIPLLGFGFDVAVLYARKGMSIDKHNLHVDYIDVPLNLKWKMGIPVAKLYLAAGPYIGLKVGDADWKGVLGQLNTKTFSAGLNFGAGVELISRLQVGFNYGLGLTNNYSAQKLDTDVLGDGKNRGWSITAAILF